ncbi:MAG: hypothetical protein R3213_09355, partial [Flavobacteriaceae bacterium]|nr:hypothetical protein [Flavobacteriaceae bacterium]
PEDWRGFNHPRCQEYTVAALEILNISPHHSSIVSLQVYEFAHFMEPGCYMATATEGTEEPLGVLLMWGLTAMIFFLYHMRS